MTFDSDLVPSFRRFLALGEGINVLTRIPQRRKYFRNQVMLPIELVDRVWYFVMEDSDSRKVRQNFSAARSTRLVAEGLLTKELPLRPDGAGRTTLPLAL